MVTKCQITSVWSKKTSPTNSKMQMVKNKRLTATTTLASFSTSRSFVIHGQRSRGLSCLPSSWVSSSTAPSTWQARITTLIVLPTSPSLSSPIWVFLMVSDQAYPRFLLSPSLTNSSLPTSVPVYSHWSRMINILKCTCGPCTFMKASWLWARSFSSGNTSGPWEILTNWFRSKRKNLVQKLQQTSPGVLQLNASRKKIEVNERKITMQT